MPRILSAIILLSVFSACTAPPEHVPHELMVLTYNIHHGEGTDGVFDLERQAQVILDSGADVVALQEVDAGTERSGGVDQAAELARLTGMHVVFGEAMPYGGGSYGEAMLSRWPILSSEVLMLPATPNHEPRAAVTVTVQPPWSSTALTVAGTHLDHTGDDTNRLAQVRTAQTRLETSGLPTLLVGDLNARPDSAPMALLFDAAWTPADPTYAPTFPSKGPDRKIDWILLAPGAPSSLGRLDSAQVLSAPLASDHCPYRARWVLP